MIGILQYLLILATAIGFGIAMLVSRSAYWWMTRSVTGPSWRRFSVYPDFGLLMMTWVGSFCGVALIWLAHVPTMQIGTALIAGGMGVFFGSIRNTEDLYPIPFYGLLLAVVGFGFLVSACL